MCDVRTLSELRRHWDLCVAYADSSESKEHHAERVKLLVREMLRTYTDPVHMGATRSAGYYWLNAFKMMPPTFTYFWNTGTTFTGGQELESAKFLNPTFLFLSNEEGFALDQESDPMSAFHLATAFKDIKEEPVPLDAVFDCAKTQFKAWCAAFRAYIRKSPDGLTIRFFSGEPLAFCTALRNRLDSGSLIACTFTRPWSTCPLTLDGGDYNDVQNGAPLQFNVVETASVMDFVSLLNLLVAVVPLISPSPSSAVFTETLVPKEIDVIKRFASHFCGDIPTISLIFDLVPTTYLSRMTTRSDRGGVIVSRTLDEPVGKLRTFSVEATLGGRLHSYQRPTQSNNPHLRHQPTCAIPPQCLPRDVRFRQPKARFFRSIRPSLYTRIVCPFPPNPTIGDGRQVAASHGPLLRHT